MAEAGFDSDKGVISLEISAIFVAGRRINRRGIFPPRRGMWDLSYESTTNRNNDAEETIVR